ncbi:MAG: hypothetical protein NVSMB3_00360 [Acidobacteriaceae bacterium]
MKISLDNLDGRGAVDYSAWVSEAGPLKVERRLNVPSTCHCILDLSSAALTTPVRKARVIVTKNDGTVLFTGYVATEPELVYSGVGLSGPVFRIAVKAISDEWLLDRRSVPGSGAGLGQNGLAALATLTDRVGMGLLSVASTGGVRDVGVFQPAQNRSWSENAGALAENVYAAYRVLGGVVGLQPAGTVVRSLSDADGSLEQAGFRVSQTRETANDVTVSGDREPATYISESFAGDGTTSVFLLSKRPFRHGSAAGLGSAAGSGSGIAGGGGSFLLVADSFDAGAFDSRVWAVSDPGSHFSFTAAGLRFSGGNGLDGQTRLEAIDAIEVGGSLVLEMGALRLESASDGVLCGLYTGDVSRQSCFAGYNVRQSNGTTVVTPLIRGVETGKTFTLQSGHTYTLRIRVHCVEMQRVRQIFYAMVNGAVRSFGGGVVDAPADLVFDLVDNGASSNTPAVILYDGTVESSPASCSFVPLNSIQLMGSVGYCRATQTGSAWVTKVSAGGVKTTQLAGSAGEGVDCTIAASGGVTFFAGRVPQAGELVTVSYRTGQRASARIQDPASVAVEATAGFPGMSQWRGKVVRPVARSTEDCESAAEALLSVASDRAATMSGSYVAMDVDDLWPGDVLAVNRAGDSFHSLVRGVTIVDELAAHELVTSHVTFASEWAEGLGLRLSETVATDVILPAVAQAAPGRYLSGLHRLTLVSASGTALQVDAGLAPPAGGGFEVRRRDGAFGPGVDQDLVLRSPVRSFSIPREAQVERYYVRMYDGSTPPLYSRLSSAIFTDIPVG